MYKTDFGDDSKVIIDFCLKHLQGTTMGYELKKLQSENTSITVKFLKYAYESWEKLTLSE
jgi:hypothetical protein